MWTPAMNQHPSHLQQQQQPPPPIHQQPPQHHFNNNNNGNNNGNINNNNNNQSSSLHSQQQQQSQSQPSQVSDAGSVRSKDLNSWCEAFDKHELVDILVKISKTNSQFQSYLGHAFVTDIKWCKIRVTFTAATATSTHQAPNSQQIQNHFMQYGNIKQIECFPTINAALITYENYTFAQSAVSVGVHENVGNTGYNASCCYEFEGNDQSHSIHINNQNGGSNQMISGPLEQRRIFVSSLSYSTSDDTLENVFSQYGELEDCTIVKDKLTGRSKGYGFVVFKSVSGAVNALKTSEKFIDGRRTRSWLAAQGNQMRNQNR